MGDREKKKLRTEFRKNRQPRTRERDLTRGFHESGDAFEEQLDRDQRLSGKGELTRKRTVVGVESNDEHSGFGVLRDVDEACLRGRVLAVYGLTSNVQTDDGRIYHCATRRLLKTLSTDLRQVVIAGDIVLFRPQGTDEGLIERVEPRHGLLCRASKGRQHVIVANVDQMLIVASAAQPDIKPNLIDRFLVMAEKTRIRPIICINKVDLVDPADFQPLVGVYGQMGYEVILLSTVTGQGLNRIRRLLIGRESTVVGQSGVGKSSLLNAIDPSLNLRINEVSTETEKGKHTTTTAQLFRLSTGGYVVDTPGIRQFELWDVIPEEVVNYYRELRPYVSRCKFPNCTHTHESDCAIKDAVADGRLDPRRYESYCHLRSGE
ncbi:MAG TPA: ribosome small subunit-dependent GTPase A [Pirellulaceae bacterium]|nr:ribosome small subunit-dependent GTPase A [Pirellulaceae bacterium]